MATSTPDFASAVDLTQYASDTPPIIDPGVYNIDLAGQLSGVPGGDTSFGMAYPADPTGISQVYTNPTLQPNSPGQSGYMSTLSSVISAAAGAFKSYESGSPSVATPVSRAPSTGALGGIFSPRGAGSAGVGPFSWAAIAAIGAGVVLVFVFYNAA